MKSQSLAVATFGGYAHRYAFEKFEVVDVEKEFLGEIRNPDTGRSSQTFRIAGDAVGVTVRNYASQAVEEPDEGPGYIGISWDGRSSWLADASTRAICTM